jgi:hypothetical protein
MALLGSFTKQPREILDFDISYATVLAGRTDTISGVVLEVAPAGLTLSTPVVTNNVMKAKASLGIDAVSYVITALATSTAGLVYEDEITVLVEEI